MAQVQQSRAALGMANVLGIMFGNAGPAAVMQLQRGAKWSQRVPTMVERYGADMARQIEAVYKEMEAKLAAKRK